MAVFDSLLLARRPIRDPLLRLAGWLLALLLGLAGMAWGELFQQPGLILGAAVVLFALGLSLFA